MPGVLITERGLMWIPPKWVFDAVIRSVRAALHERLGLSEVLDRVLERQQDLELFTLPDPVRSEFLLTVKRAYDATVHAGAATLYKPEFFPIYLEQFQRLQKVLDNDVDASDGVDPLLKTRQ